MTTMSDALGTPGVGNLATGAAVAGRVRAALEGSRAVGFAGGRSLTPSVELAFGRTGATPRRDSASRPAWESSTPTRLSA